MHIYGERYEYQTDMVVNSSSFIVKDSIGDVVAYLDETGNLFLRGMVYENADIGG
jgi:hypothetical protein